MATLTIIKPDNNIAEDGVWRTVDCSGLASNVHAVQWDGSAGWIEYNDGTVNETIDSISAYSSLTKRRNEKKRLSEKIVCFGYMGLLTK